jgi:hypothetical protein
VGHVVADVLGRADHDQAKDVNIVIDDLSPAERERDPHPSCNGDRDRRMTSHFGLFTGRAPDMSRRDE